MKPSSRPGRTEAAGSGKVMPMIAGLMLSRRFAPLFWSQFFSAFNDNLVRNMLAIMILFKVGEDSAGPLVTLAVAVFILPSILLSGLGGELADSHDKARVARWLKIAEVFIQILAAVGFLFVSVASLYVALFGLGVIATLYSPIKYGILPDHLRREELTLANALVEGATFFAILLGLAAGGMSGVETTSKWSVLAQLFGVSLACLVSTWFVPSTGAAAPNLRINRNIFASTVQLLRDLKSDYRLWIGGIGGSWFWLSGSVTLSLVPIVVKQRIGGGVEVETAISVFFAIGVGLGAMLAGWLAHGRIFIKHVPYATAFMGFFLIDTGLATHSLGDAHGQMALGEFLRSGIGLRVALDLTGLACAGGLFSVPLFAAVQSWAPKDHRARVVAGVGVMNAIFMVFGSAATALLQSKFVGVSNPILMMALGVANVAAAVYFFRVLPEADTEADVMSRRDAALRPGE